MELNWFESVIFGLLAGLTEFLPVSSAAHRFLALHLFGAAEGLPMMVLFTHGGALAGLILSIRDYLRRLNRERLLRQSRSRRRHKNVDVQSAADISLVKFAAIPVVISFLFYGKTIQWGNKLYIVALFLLLNAVILHIPMYLPTGNKDSRNMSKLDGLLIGLISMLSVFPGVSRIAAFSSAAIGRGAAPQQAYRWSLLVSIPALFIMLVWDLVSVFSTGVAGMGFTTFLQCLVAGVTACFGAAISVTLMQKVFLKNGISHFSYYCLGAALFSFILYLI